MVVVINECWWGFTCAIAGAELPWHGQSKVESGREHVGRWGCRAVLEDRDPGMEQRHVQVPSALLGLRRKTLLQVRMQMLLGTGYEMR